VYARCGSICISCYLVSHWWLEILDSLWNWYNENYSYCSAHLYLKFSFIVFLVNIFLCQFSSSYIVLVGEFGWIRNLVTFPCQMDWIFQIKYLIWTLESVNNNESSIRSHCSENIGSECAREICILLDFHYDFVIMFWFTFHFWLGNDQTVWKDLILYITDYLSKH